MILGARGLGRAIARPFPPVDHNGLTGVDVDYSCPMFHPQQSGEHYCVLVEFGSAPGSTHPPGLRICAILTSECPEFTRPTNSSIRLAALLPPPRPASVLESVRQRRSSRRDRPRHIPMAVDPRLNGARLTRQGAETPPRFDCSRIVQPAPMLEGLTAAYNTQLSCDAR